MKFTPRSPEAKALNGGYRLVTSPDIANSAGSPARPHLNFSAAEWRRVGGIYGVIALLHLLGCSLFFHYSMHYPALIGLGFAAYMFGLRHAFDADHIAAVDDTVRYLLQKGQKPLGIGFFFSLGHSTVVLVLALTIIFAATSVKQELPELQQLGGVIGASVSGIFLWLIGILNLLLLLDMLKIWRKAKSGQHSHAHLDELLLQRGLLNRLFGGRLQKMVQHSWQMYPLGLLFGMGFDTASEIGLLAMTAGAASGNLPMGAVLSLPILFAAGMSLMDSTDGILMLKAYSWAFVNPLRKIFYNLTTTCLSIAVALVIGSIELLQVFIDLMHLNGPFYDYVVGFDFGMLGYVIVAIFLLVWGGSAALWKYKRFEERHRHPYEPHAHEHTHRGGVTHVHKHFH
ncbi:MAG: HoxN/HupN/NixA family nickel/cobalt transporter [Thiobacillaceae bacterium]|jgi:high-affinity nickel-transport protein